MTSPPTGGDVYALEGNTNPTAVPDPRAVAGLRLGEACPNPARGRTVWNLSSERGGKIDVALYSANGRRVRELPERAVTAGAGLELSWDGRDGEGRPVAAGVYQARVYLNGRPAAERRVVVVR